MNGVFIGAKVVIRESGELGFVFAHDGSVDGQCPWIVAELVQNIGYADYNLYCSSELLVLGSFGDAYDDLYHPVLNVWAKHFMEYTVASFLKCYNDHVGLTQKTLEGAGLTLSGCIGQ